MGRGGRGAFFDTAGHDIFLPRRGKNGPKEPIDCGEFCAAT